MPSRRTLTTPQCKGVVPIVTVIDGTVKCLTWTMNSAQLVQVSPIPKTPPERDRENMSALNEGKETKDGNEASDRESKEVKLSKLRSILKTVATGHELGKKYSAANKTNVSSLEKACMIRESQSAETITDFTSDEDYVSCEEEESLSENDSVQTEEREHSSSMSTTDTSGKEEEESSTTEASDKEEESEIPSLSEDTDGSVHERCLLISSAANIRRREMQGQGYYYKENRNQVPEERKKKLIKKKLTRKESLASLEDLRKEVKRATSEDTRGLKKKNPRRAVASVEKWQTSGMWKEIV